MPEHQTRGEAFALADAFFAECQVVARFIDEKVRLRVDERVGAVPGGIVFQVQMLRAIAWLRSLAKLNHPGDFQAVTAAARALFEGAVDVTLLHYDPATFPPERMDAWQDSAKLKHAETVARYLAETGRDASGEHREVLAYAKREKARIEALRSRWWPNYNGKHPSRWTGLDLAADAKAADALLDEGFQGFYRLRYPQLCWNVHGSGAAGIANIAPEHFPFIGGMAAPDARGRRRLLQLSSEAVAAHGAVADGHQRQRRRDVLHQPVLREDQGERTRRDDPWTNRPSRARWYGVNDEEPMDIAIQRT